MKRAILTIRLLFFAAAILAAHAVWAATPPQQRFEKANALYKQQQYTEAAALYQQLIDEAFLSPELYVNAGNAFTAATRWAKQYTVSRRHCCSIRRMKPHRVTLRWPIKKSAVQHNRFLYCFLKNGG
ncbi:hypothetical protein MKQ70_27500 [Chitinophaga sedimenti]|uniref:hypothetical protein n=1 Tax=Chitinophaga sedimenti TaxID=2033606 RepID=UPI002003E331|nr:hypothetical protein [Chitinophaga sedimenti]MCK7558537.1 hypothetical protein [Chitinophaga sedimenti]